MKMMTDYQREILNRMQEENLFYDLDLEELIRVRGFIKVALSAGALIQLEKRIDKLIEERRRVVDDLGKFYQNRKDEMQTAMTEEDRSVITEEEED